MNHPTDEIEELYLLSKEAVACEDFKQAAAFLRRAIELAPLRKELRAELARVLAYEEEQVSLDEPAIFARRSVYGDSGWSSPTALAPAGTSTRSAVRTVPSTALATAMRGPVGTAAVTSGTRHSVAERPRVSVRTEGNVNLHLDEEPISFSDSEDLEAMEESARSALHRLLEEEDEQVERAPVNTRKRNRRSRLIQEPSSLEDWLAGGFERSILLLKKTHPARFAYGSCYFVLAIFVAAACIQSKRVFGKQSGIVARSAKHDNVTTRVQQSSMAMPSLFSSTAAPVGPTEEEVLAKGREYVASRKFDSAIVVLEPAMQSGTRTASRDLIRQTLAQAYDGKGTAELQQSNLSAAVRLYRQAANLLPASGLYQLHLSNALYYEGVDSSGADRLAKFHEAARLASEIVRTEPQNTNAYSVLALSQESLGRFAEARSAWQRVVNLSSKGSAGQKKALEQLQHLKGV
ncbi:MAG: tetratricopeptide repeat protein [Candidatus Sumerlaeaceae bacterium]